jgi:hypothetical protein
MSIKFQLEKHLLYSLDTDITQPLLVKLVKEIAIELFEEPKEILEFELWRRLVLVETFNARRLLKPKKTTPQKEAIVFMGLATLLMGKRPEFEDYFIALLEVELGRDRFQEYVISINETLEDYLFLECGHKRNDKIEE